MHPPIEVLIILPRDPETVPAQGPCRPSVCSSADGKGSSCPFLFWHSRIIVQQDYITLGVHSSTCKGTGMTGQMDTGMDKQPPRPRMVMVQAAFALTPLHVHTHQCQAVSHPSDLLHYPDCHPEPWSGHKHQCLLLPPGSWGWPSCSPSPLGCRGGCATPCTPVPRQPGARTLIAMAGAGSVRAAPVN